MIQNNQIKYNIRRSNERGHADHGWLNSFHTFSFANYYDPQHMGFRSLRVINDDTVDPGRGFGAHPHRDMEIISVVLSGALEHKDSMGNGSVIRQGDVQRISAGTGITHSEFNHSSREDVHFLQIWIEPNARGLTPSYDDINLDNIDTKDGLKLIASPSGIDQSMKINQDAWLYHGHLSEQESVFYSTDPNRGVWIHLIAGQLHVFGQELHPGDAMSIEQLDQLKIQAKINSTFLLFDLK